MADEFLEQDTDTPTEQDLDAAYGSRFLGVDDVGTRKIRAKVKKVSTELLTGKDGTKRKRFILFFETLDKGLVLITTNKDAIVDAVGKNPAKWIGVSVGIFVDPNVSFGGKRTGGIRLRVLPPSAASKAPVMPPEPPPPKSIPEAADMNDPLW